jgi:Holliday junction resolvasome RuvABC DNA-binding subunit
MALAPSSIARAIAERDARFLQRLPEIGPKLAELIVHELKNKVDAFVSPEAETPAPSHADKPAAERVEPKPVKKVKLIPADAANAAAPVPPPAAPPPIRQTIDALVALGESPIDAERMVNRAIDKARAAKLALPSSTQELLTAAYAARN